MCTDFDKQFDAINNVISIIMNNGILLYADACILACGIVHLFDITEQSSVCDVANACLMLALNYGSNIARSVINYKIVKEESIGHFRYNTKCLVHFGHYAFTTNVIITK